MSSTTEASSVARPRKKRRRSNLQRKQTRLAWLMLLPALAAVGFVALYPLGQTIYYSFTDQQFLAGIEPTKWIGLENYKDLIHDTLFRDAVVLTIKFTLITVFFEFVLGMIIALTVNSGFKGRGVMRAMMLVPWAIPTVVSALMWKWMYNDLYGVVNDAGVRLHLFDHNVAWIAQPSTALGAAAASDIWKTTPFVALLLLAGLQVIPTELYEAAKRGRRERLAAVLADHAAAAAACDPRRADLPHPRRAARLRRLLRLLRKPAGHADDGDLRSGHDRRHR